MQPELQFFNELVTKLIENEKKEPVVSPLSTETVIADLDLSFSDEPMDDEEWKKVVENSIEVEKDAVDNKAIN